MVLGLFSCEIDALLRRANCFLIRYGTRILFLHNGSYWEAVDDRVREDLMKFGFGMTAVVALLVVFFTIPVTAAEILTLKATDGRFKIQGGFYPNYLVFLKGLDPSTIKTGWVDKEYYAVLDVHEGPEAGQSAIMTLKKTSDRSPQPEWCKTEGGENFKWKGITCLKNAEGLTEQLRFKVKVKWPDSAAALPAELQDRTWAEYPELPGRREFEELGAFDLHIVLD